MNVFTNITSATRAALLYITVGALMIVWSAIYYVYLNNHPADHATDTPYYWCTGFMLSGVTLLLIGLAVGLIGRSARQAEQPHAIINTQDSLGNPTQDVVPVANTAPAPVPLDPAVRQPVVVQQTTQPQVPLQPVVAARSPNSRT